MRINSIPSKDLYLQYVSNTRDMYSAVAARPSMGTDKVELTDGAKSFSAALRAAKGVAVSEPASQAKVEGIMKRIQNNDYNIPGEAVAEKMLGL